MHDTKRAFSEVKPNEFNERGLRSKLYSFLRLAGSLERVVTESLDLGDLS